MSATVYGVRGASGMPHIMKGPSATWCGFQATPTGTDPVAGHPVCSKCRHNLEAFQQRETEWRKRWG